MGEKNGEMEDRLTRQSKGLESRLSVKVDGGMEERVGTLEKRITDSDANFAERVRVIVRKERGRDAGEARGGGGGRDERREVQKVTKDVAARGAQPGGFSHDLPEGETQNED